MLLYIAFLSSTSHATKPQRRVSLTSPTPSFVVLVAPSTFCYTASFKLTLFPLTPKPISLLTSSSFSSNESRPPELIPRGIWNTRVTSIVHSRIRNAPYLSCIERHYNSIIKVKSFKSTSKLILITSEYEI